MHPFSRSRLLPALVLLMGANAWSATTVFNVLDYGAHNDGSAPATEAIRSAIQAAKAAGGGTVYVPATRLPFTKGRAQGIECLTPVPLIGGANVENVTITGRGAISTNNADWTKLMGGPQTGGPFWSRLGAPSGIAGTEDPPAGGGVPEDCAATPPLVHPLHGGQEYPD